MTELFDISVNLDPNVRAGLGEIKIGELKDFQLTVTVQTGYESGEADLGPAVGA